MLLELKRERNQESERRGVKPASFLFLAQADGYDMLFSCWQS